ncbi:MAG: TonB-dependent receptor [Gammaproteobacteria bacterium]|jgi:iron complex outermembrane receptor protein|nr:TonB-dependent receptor [Gammaproteobacteria bacterium]
MKSGYSRAALRPFAARIALLSSGLLLTTAAVADQAPDQAPAPAPQQASPTAASAATVSTTDSDDSTIVVTALRRSTSIQQTPLAISAISEQTLTNMGISDSQQLARSTPSLVFRENANGGSRVIIRNIQAAGEPTVGLYYDETPVIGSVGVTNDAGGSTPEIRLFDIERAEVLRGPQGTLYGAGSMAGTVRLIFNKPNLVNYEGAVQGQVSSVAHGGWGDQEQGMVNLPLISNMLAVRIIGFRQERSGWLDNNRLGLRDFNDRSSDGGRVLARFKPNEDVTLDGLAVIQNTRGWNNNWNYQSYLGGDQPYDQNYESLQPQTDKLRVYSGTLNWNLGFAALTAVGSYSDRALTANFDYSPYFRTASNNATATSAGCKNYNSTGGASCTPTQLTGYKQYALSLDPITAYQPQDTTTTSEEIRLSSVGDTRFKWTIGGYGSHRTADILSQLNTVDPATGRMLTPVSAVPVVVGSVTRAPTVAYQRTVADVLDQYAGFGEVSYDVTSKLSLTAGTRYFNYKKATTGAVQIGNPVIGVVVSPATTARFSENGTVSKFNVDYKFSDDLLGYAQASQGFRPGGVNQVIGLPDKLGPYKSDSLWDYEAGLKSSWLDRKVIINADIFQINWNNIQSSAQTTTAQSNGSTFSFITNAGKVRVRGAEFESTYRPRERLVLQASGSYTLARLQGNQTAPAGITITGAGVDGDYVPFTPKVTAQAAAQYTFPISGGLEILARGDVNYIGDSWTVYHRTNAYQQKLPGYSITGLRSGVQSDDDRWGAYLFVNNLFDKIGLTNKSNGASQGGADAVRVLAEMPRVIGLDFRFRF